MADEPHPQLQPILDMVERTPNLEEVGVEAARQQFDAVATFTPDHEVHDEFDITVEGADGSLNARVYRPGEGEQPLEDAYAAVEWVADNPDAVGGDGTVAVGGDSAGANLSAGVSLMARDADRDVTTDETGPEIAHQLLYYPVCGSPFEEYLSREANAEGYFLERDTMEWFDDQYVESDVHHRNEYLAPLLCEDLSGLPPATVVTAGFDPLRDEGDAYAEALEANGVDVFHTQYDAMIHGFVSFIGMVEAADDAIRVAASGLNAEH
ncbi:alpha/beta hydrolase [Halobacteriales archaeon QS_7_69_60]|nr:MAG: alpha/beta hydrolase [Halobacteriales archaeon QS_7_69_60]